MAEIIVINPTKKFAKDEKITRIAAYVRVSSESDDQENSFINQYDYYSRLIAENPSWSCVDIYADNGITGTELENRDEFRRMYSDCENGKIDCIITKSISRFARNTYDCIDTIRKLKILGVDVIFERENINTKNMKGETELAALSSIAQEESMSLSKNVRMGIRQRMANGTFKQGCIPYGYVLENDKWEIVESEARVIKVIFNAYINGKSLRKIAQELQQAGIMKADGRTNWTAKRIQYILTNERYKGDALLQKTYTEDFPFKSRNNHGERDMYYVKNYNPPIVDKETFDKANELLKTQRERYYTNPQKHNHTLTKMVYCAECKTLFRKKSGNTGYWVCRTHDIDSERCHVPQISETSIYKGFVNMYNRLINNMEYTLTPMLNVMYEYRERQLRTKGELEYINNEIAKTTEQILVLNKLKADGFMESALFMEKCNELNAKITRLKKDKKIIFGNDECEKTIKLTGRLISILEQSNPIASFNKGLFHKIINKVWIDQDKNIGYELINGLKLTIAYREVE